MISSLAIASRTFTLTDQRGFARLSGDFNPLHLDAQFARRTPMGAPVVHGIHTLLWALESVLRVESFDIKNVRVHFRQPLFLEETASLRIVGRSENAINLDVVVDRTVIAAIRLASQIGKIAGVVAESSIPEPHKLELPSDLPFEQMSDQRGAVAPAASEHEIRCLFPMLSNAMGPSAVTGLMATSRIVGMACPGLHSLFAGLDVTLNSAPDGPPVLGYAVKKIDARFRSVEIDIAGLGLAGRLDAFARPRPPAQADINAVSARVAGKPFAGQRSLVIGGSRGLGEVTARIIAAGGGHPIITYREGRQEADRLASEIRRAGATCEVMQYDALERDHALAESGERLSHVRPIDSCYYFATAKIFQRKSELFEPDKLAVFLGYYVDGFAKLYTELTKRSSGTIAIFYPSTTALDAPVAGTAEYAMAKAAGEMLVSHLNAFHPNLKIISRRLPRIATDQTATVGVASAQDALDVLLPIVHEVQQATQASHEKP